MEREYGIIETTYRTSTQHWWVFRNKEAVLEALRMYEGDSSAVSDPELMVLDLQVRFMDVSRILAELKSIRSKDSVTERDKTLLLNIVMNELPLIAKIVKNALNYGDRYKDYILKFKLAIKLTNDILKKISRTRSNIVLISEEPLDEVRLGFSNE